MDILFGIVLLALLASLALSVLLYVLYVFELLNSPASPQWREALGMPLPAALAAGCAMSFATTILVSLTYPWEAILRLAARVRPAIPREVEAGKPIVLLFHGLYHNGSAWAFFKRWLRLAGYGPLYSPSYSSWRYDFFKLVDFAHNELFSIQQKHPGKPVVLIGHSLGGLMVRALVSRLENEGNDFSGVAAAVTLGAPHGGSKLGALGIGRLARSLMPADPVFQALRQGDVPAPCPCLALSSCLDEYVLPLENLSIDVPGWAQRRTRPVSHVAMLYHRPTVDMAMEFMEEAMRRRAGR